MVQQLEARYVNSWLELNYPNYLQWKRVRLGALPNTQLSRAFSVTQGWVDAIIKTDGEIILVEAKLKPTVAALAQLELYDRLFPQTNSFSEYKDMSRRLVFLTTSLNQDIKDQSDMKGIDYVVYAPDFVMNALIQKGG